MIKTFGRLTISSKNTERMEPTHMPEINLCKANLMKTELLIRAHQKQLVQYVK